MSYGFSKSGVPPDSVLFGGTVPPYSVLFGGTVPPNRQVDKKTSTAEFDKAVPVIIF